MSTSPHVVTRLLVDWGNGDQQALEKLTPLVYQELKRLAARYLRRERREHTLQSTALVHEAWLRLIDQKQVHWQNRAQFFGIAAEMIRRILIDHARGRQAAKRGDGAIKLSLDDALATPNRRDLDLVALDDALRDLAKLDPQQGRLVELRFFAGLSIEESAEVLGVSPATVKREWTAAKGLALPRNSARGPTASDFGALERSQGNLCRGAGIAPGASARRILMKFVRAMRRCAAR